MKKWWVILLLLGPVVASAQPYTRQDTLRGSNGRGRDWWDVLKYDLSISIDTATKSISGTNTITVIATRPPRDSMQIDLQAGFVIDKVTLNVLRENIDDDLEVHQIVQEGNVWWLKIPKNIHWDRFGESRSQLIIHFHGKPRVAVNPPWDGGFIWTKDSLGHPWIAVACQGLGASSWWPCKDYQGDEPDSGMTIRITDEIGALANGNLSQLTITPDVVASDTGHSYYHASFSIKNPINAYNATFYIGDYAHYHDTLHGEKGILDLDFYPLKYNMERAKKHWAVTKEMLHCFEYWMGPYPFYEDGYKLVEAPYLGMEHQSAVAYGNQYKMGYLGHDRSGTGVGMAFDFIIVHESGHEWFGNNLTAQDIADNWLHEGFTTYTEALFAEWIKGRDSAFAYTTGEWKNIRNDRPVIGDYGVNKEGSNDMYDKGSAVVHMIRMMLHDDQKFRQLLRGLNKDFYHSIVTSKEVEDYISRFIGKDLKPFFDQYLRSKELPVLSAKPLPDRRNYMISFIAGPGLELPIYSDAGEFQLNLSAKNKKVISAKQLVWIEKNYLIKRITELDPVH